MIWCPTVWWVYPNLLSLSWTLVMEAAGSPEILMHFHQTPQHHILHVYVYILCKKLYLLNRHYRTDVHRAMHHNIISTVKPTRCTNVSNLFILERRSTFFGQSFHPSSAVQDCTYSNRHLSNGYCCLLASGYLLVSRYPLASRQQCLYDSNVYSLELLMTDGKTVQNM